MTKYLLLLILLGAVVMLVGRCRHQRSWFNVGIGLLSLGVLLWAGFVLLVMLSPNM